MTTQRLVFMGTPAFAVPALEALLSAGHDIACVYSQPPRRAGRSQKERPAPVAEAATSKGIEVRTPTSFRNAEEVAKFQSLTAHIAVVVAYGLILPREILYAPRLGCINAHASLLPRWRGAAPIQRAIMAGDEVTGVTIMQMDEGLDTGDMLLRRDVPIDGATTAGSLHDTLATLSADLLVAAVAGLAAGELTPEPQPAEGVTYAEKIDKAEARIDWREPAAQVIRKIRGLTPYPGAWFEHDGARIRVLEARPADASPGGEPGTVLTGDGLTITCGDDTSLALTRVQRAGKAALDIEAFLRGHSIPPGTTLSCPATG